MKIQPSDWPPMPVNDILKNIQILAIDISSYSAGPNSFNNPFGLAR